MHKITIPKPCNEDWNKMLPHLSGRFCNACAKTVVDFTEMSKEEIKNFFVEKSSSKICGRFFNDQVKDITINLSPNLFKRKLPVWKLFLAASLIVFSSTLFSFTTNYTDTYGLINPSITDTIKPNTSQHLLGKIKLPTPSKPIKKHCNKNATMGIIATPQMLTGEVQFVPDKKN